MRCIVRKLKNTNGDTLAEVMIAFLIAMFAVLLFATAIGAAYKILDKADARMNYFYTAGNKAESVSEILKDHTEIQVSHDSTVSGLISSDDLNNITVNVYGTDDIMSYRKVGS